MGLLLMVFIGCGTGRSPFTPDVTGDWEVSAASASSGTTDLIQVRLTQSANDANGTGAVLYTEENNNFTLGGSCPAGTGKNSVAIKFANGSPFNFAYTENGYNFAGTGQYDGKAMAGTYTASSGSGCQDAGNWTAHRTPVIHAKFSGSPNPGLVVDLQVTENSANHSMTATGTLSGAITATLDMTGSYVGNAISGQLKITVNNQPFLTKPINFYYSPSQKALYTFEADGTFDGKFDQQ
jgi:hypothetical protein